MKVRPTDPDVEVSIALDGRTVPCSHDLPAEVPDDVAVRLPSARFEQADGTPLTAASKKAKKRADSPPADTPAEGDMTEEDPDGSR